MARIVPKLNLNKTPQNVENQSLIFAKNIRLLKDNSIGPDTSLEEIETTTGDGTHHTEHHDEIVEEVKKFYYSILDSENTLNVIEGNDLTDNPEFHFYTDNEEDNYDDNYKNSDRDIYSHVYESEVHTISCYKLNGDEQPVWIQELFSYNINYNRLEDTTGLILFIGIRIDIYTHEDAPELDAPEFFYFVGPKELLTTTIPVNFNDNEVKYVVCNPVYSYLEYEQIIVQPAYDEEWDEYSILEYKGHIVGLDNKIYFFKENISIKDSSEARDLIRSEFPNAHFVDEEYVGSDPVEFDINEYGYITRNGVLFKDSSIASELFPNVNDRIKIFEYDEVLNKFKIVECGWKYSGGEINGCVSVNGTGEYILTICEYKNDNSLLVPIKHINLNRCSENDNESFYTQTPNIPISNLKLSGRYIKNIPSGVYQFFIRYKIRDEFYTNWFPCSKELFAGSRKTIDTLQGSIKYNDLHEDSNNSFIFTVEHLYPEYCGNYEEFQLGFIISADGGVFARSWKHFNMSLASSVSIYFDYEKTDIEEINIDDLLKVNYNIFNVANIAQHKNKLYIANYTETDFNEPALQNYANNVKVTFDLYKVNPLSGVYINNIPLGNKINNVYTTIGNTQINNIYYDSFYCNIVRNKTNAIAFDYTQSIIYGTQTGYVDPQIRIRKLYLVDDNDNNYTLYERFQIPNTIGDYGYVIANNISPKLANEQPETIINAIIDDVREQILGVDSDGNFKIDINGSIKTITSFCIDYFSLDGFHQEATIYEGHPATRIYILGYNNTLKVDVTLKNSILTTTYIYNEYNTFLPFTKYDFYIHYVTQNGIATNGYYICTKEIKRYCKQYKPVATSDVPSDVRNGVIPSIVIEDLDVIGDLAWYDSYYHEYASYTDENQDKHWYKLEEITTNDYIIIPNFDNIICPEGYVGCFISYTKYGNNVAQGYNYESNYDSTGNETTHKVDCLELNSLLYNTNNNITVKDSKGNTITTSANYYPSGTTNPVEYLGGSGHVEFTSSGDSSINTKCWLIVDSTGKPYNKQLVKLTPFIKLNQTEAIGYSELVNLNSPGYFCEVRTLNRKYCTDYTTGYYVSGNDIYKRGEDSDNNNAPCVELCDDRVEYHNSTRAYIFSNYNLNYVSLTTDLAPIIRRYDVDTEDDAEDGIVTKSTKQFITLVNSLLASNILELKGFYKEYTRKTYQEYTNNKLTKFDNTVRVSSVDVDELYRYIYRFEATDYYNVPTQRGIITNLIGIANSLYVHCENSLFKFTDNKTLNAQEEEVTLQENDIFNSGISEVFDAQFGYGGLKDRKQSLITFNAYVFYDSVAKTIYAFGGEQQIGNISESIQKLIDLINPTDVRFVGDELNDRFFVNLRNNEGNVCLSFNFKSKSFISIHDIDFNFGFHTRRHTYFEHDNYFNGDKIGWSIYRITDKLNINDINYYIAYQNCYTPSLLSIQDTEVISNVKAVNACIDIITNVEYEKIKVLNYVNWICSEILNYAPTFNYVAEEELNRLYPGDKIRIYSDSTSTDLIELIDENGNPKLSREQRNITSSGNINAVKESWQYPTYNCGVFSMNYFRDIITNGNVYTAPNPDLFKYKDAPNIGPNGLVDLTKYVQRQNLTQESSLIYGKYFVLRLIFNNRNFKIENVTFRMGDYGKTK